LGWRDRHPGRGEEGEREREIYIERGRERERESAEELGREAESTKPRGTEGR
jgi:hypothetical protein